METTIDEPVIDAEACRRLAHALGLDAVGVLRRDPDGGRTLTWWAMPDAPTLPLDVEAIVEGRVDGWIVTDRGGDLVFGRLTDASSADALRVLGGAADGSDEASRARPPEARDPLDADRSRWAYAIHDGLTQIVTAVVLDLEWLSRQTQTDSVRATEALAEAATELRAALEDVRAILGAVTPNSSTRGWRRSLDELLRRVSDRWHVPASWSAEGDLDRIPAAVMDAAESVIREGVANAAKHASARSVAVRVHARPTELEVSVEDAGRGFHVDDVGPHAGHLGLELMRRRVAELRGTLDIQSEPERGTRVVARLPVEEGETP